MQPNVSRLSRGLYRITISLGPSRQLVRWFPGNERNAKRYAAQLAKEQGEIRYG